MNDTELLEKVLYDLKWADNFLRNYDEDLEDILADTIQLLKERLGDG